MTRLDFNLFSKQLRSMTASSNEDLQSKLAKSAETFWFTSFAADWSMKHHLSDPLTNVLLCEFQRSVNIIYCAQY